MNVISGAGSKSKKFKSVTLLPKQKTVVLEEKGVAILIHFDRSCNKFAVEDLTEKDTVDIKKKIEETMTIVGGK